jgi:bifunctional non-homologous end joining protein LigD
MIVGGVPITSPERVVYPKLGFSKLDLARLYADLADWILPYVADRPLTLVRCDKGVSRADALRSECKFLRHEPGYHRWAGAHIRRLRIQEQRKVGEYLVVDSLEGLISLVQGDILEIHCWNSRCPRLEQPDRFVFDLDPGADVAFDRVVEAAVLLRRKLESVGLQSWPKLSGGKGVHIVVPFAPEHDWSEVYAVARLVAESLVREDPASLTLDFAKSGRNDKILVDYKRNHRAAVAVAAYSARATPQGSVCVPVTWSELGRQTASDSNTVITLRKRLARRARDPWREFYECHQRLGGERLGSR